MRWLTCLVAAALAIGSLAGTAIRPAYASITAGGNLTGTGTPYNGIDDPWNVGDLTVGNTARGSMSITGGSDVNNSGAGVIANASAASTSSVIVDGSGSTWTNSARLNVGYSGAGTLDVTNGGSVSNAGAYIAGAIGGDGAVSIDGTGSAWTCSDFLFVGYSGSGTLEITGGGSVSNTYAYLGVYSVGTVIVDGSGSRWTNSLDLRVGNNGTGILQVTNGGSLTSTGALLGNQSGSHGTVTIDGAGSTWTNSASLRVGLHGSGTFNVTNGGSVSNTDGHIDGASGTNGTATIEGAGSTWTNSASLIVGFSGTGTLNINHGGLVSATALNGGNATSNVNLDGGKLRITGTDTASNRINLLAGGGTFDVPTMGTTFSITGAMSGAGGLTKTGGAKLILNQASTYTGNTTIDGGTLLANNASGSATGTGSVAVNNLATFGGHGVVSGAVTVNAGGTIAPFTSFDIGSLALTDSTSKLALEIDPRASIMSAGLLTITGNLTLADSTLNLTIHKPPAYLAPTTFLVGANDAADPVSGVFGLVSGLPSGYQASIDYAFAGTDALGRIGDGNDLAITLSAVLPGDYNRNGFVDAADYVSWRKLDGTQSGYDVWSANFGTRTLAGIGSYTVVNVPEPAMAGITILAAIALLGLYEKRAKNR